MNSGRLQRACLVYCHQISYNVKDVKNNNEVFVISKVFMRPMLMYPSAIGYTLLSVVLTSKELVHFLYNLSE